MTSQFIADPEAIRRRCSAATPRARLAQLVDDSAHGRGPAQLTRP